MNQKIIYILDNLIVNMAIFFEVIKWFFFIMSVFLWVFKIKGKDLISADTFGIIDSFVMPWYLVFCGIMVWYFITSFFASKYEYDKELSNKIYSRWFIFGLILWVILAILNIYYK